MKFFQRLSLYLLSCIYECLTTGRNRLYESGFLKTYKANIPVISVGNLTLGGNAKTPLVVFLARELKGKGFQPVVLLKGYKAKIRGPYVVQLQDTAQLVGDEALLVAKKLDLPVVISHNKSKGAEFISKQGLGNIIILDDGFQHRQLERNLDLVAVNVCDDKAVQDFLDGFILPLGNFRENKELALKRADILIFAERKILTHKTVLDQRLFKTLPDHLKIFRGFLFSEGVEALCGTNALKGASDILAFCSIANPGGFFESLKSLGFVIQAQKLFSDHYAFLEDDLNLLAQEFPGLPLVCTEKDAVKIDPNWPVSKQVFVLKTNLQVQPKDAFIVEILKSV